MCLIGLSKYGLFFFFFPLQVTLPFFVLHGEADTVTDPEVSRALYEKASSRDKTMKLYPGMWHGLTSGEPDENVEIVFADVITWLDKHINERDHISIQRPIHGLNNSVVRLAAAAAVSPEKVSRKARTQSYGSYLCGLKGRRLQHHSAM